MSHLQYVDDLLVLIVGGIDDLRIIKLILNLFEGMSGLAINFHKTSIFSTTTGQLAKDPLVQTLSRSKGMLPSIYLGCPYLGVGLGDMITNH